MKQGVFTQPGSLSDIAAISRNVRFTPNSDQRSGHGVKCKVRYASEYEGEIALSHRVFDYQWHCVTLIDTM